MILEDNRGIQYCLATFIYSIILSILIFKCRLQLHCTDNYKEYRLSFTTKVGNKILQSAHRWAKYCI